MLNGDGGGKWEQPTAELTAQVSWLGLMIGSHSVGDGGGKWEQPTGELTTQVSWLGLTIGSHSVLFCIPHRNQDYDCCDDSIIHIVMRNIIIICPIAIAYSMGQIIKSVCVCQCVRLRALSRSHFLIDFYQNWHRRKYPQKEERVH